MLVGFLLAFIVTDKAWKKFQTNPTFTSLMLSHEGMKIIYPSVSVCPNFAVDPRKVAELVGKFGDISNQTKQELEEFLSAIPNFSYGSDGLKSFVFSDVVRRDVHRLALADPRALAFQLASSCYDVLRSCKFSNKEFDCCDVFLPIYSEHGFCYSFNSRVYGTSHDE